MMTDPIRAVEIGLVLPMGDLLRRWPDGSLGRDPAPRRFGRVIPDAKPCFRVRSQGEFGGVWRSWLTHVLWEHEIVGSNPTTPTIP
jgi:hypothetical protein